MVETMPLVLARPTCMRLWSLSSPYVPQTEKTVDMVVRQCHDDPSAGHYGGSKTLRRVCDQFHWPRKRQHVLEYVRRCDICQRMKLHGPEPSGPKRKREGSASSGLTRR